MKRLNHYQAIKNDLQKHINAERAVFLSKFMRAFPGGYGEGDQFIGVTVPNLRTVARKYYKEVSLNEVELLLNEPIHEYRLIGLFIMVLKYKKAKPETEKKSIVEMYLENIHQINNWDLVDSSADKILGPYLMDKDKDLLYGFAESDDVWKQRVAIITTFHFIRNKHFNDTLKIAKILLNHKHDLIHKAVGWMLREIGSRDLEVEVNFLKVHYKQMPRTMLRYAIEKFEENLRQQFLKGLV
ncbi:MAG TPA: DNA alkylation repair protein [Desulfobacteria bacterium]|nr:DNA alkylation repair protein [Desulfobacteria bacterium]